ncbi:MAG: leucine-rich repeat protein [Christensenellales bacterium]
MKRNLRRILSLLLLALLLVSAVPLSPAVAEGPFVIDNDGVLTAYNGPGGNVKIPKEVKVIGPEVFRDRYDITGITIPNTVTEIGDKAFFRCTGLKKVTLPQSVKTIGNQAFRECLGLTRISISKNVTQIGAGAFENCVRLAAVSIPKGVLEIRGDTFAGCAALKKVNIPNGVTTIGDWAFYGCWRLTGISIPKSVTQIGKYAFSYCESLARISIPDGVTTIRNSTFYRCYSLSQVDMGRGITTIESGAFMRCTSLTDIVLPNSVQTIEGDAFAHCTGLSSVIIPESATTIEGDAFYRCPNVRLITASEAVQESLGGAFPDSAFAILHLPNDLLPPALFLQVGQTMALPKFNGAKVKWHIVGEAVEITDKGKKIKGVQAGEGALKLEVLAAKGKALTLNGQPLKPGTTHDIPLRVFAKGVATARKVAAAPKKMTLHPAGAAGYPKNEAIVPTFTPANLPFADEWAKNCTYVSSNPGVAQVDMKGTVHAVRPGKATVTVFAPNMKTTKVSVTVKGFVTDIRLKGPGGGYLKSLTLATNGYFELIPEFNADAALTAVRWSSSKPAVVYVNGSGRIFATSEGTAKITATALDGSGKKTTVTVTVVENIWN